MPCEECENGKYKWGKTGSCKYDTKADCEKDNKDYYEDMKETKIVELIIQDENQELAIDAISLVTSPAIEQDFVFFGKEKNNLTFAKVDEEKRMLVSPALIPNKQIFRHDPNTDSDYYVYFSPDTVRKASELYLRHNNHHKATYQHQDRVSGVLTVESWIKEGDQDKSKLYGYDLPNGTWFVKMKIENDELWQKIKAGELKGLSIEGYFTNKFEQMQKTKPTTEQILSAFNELVREGKVTTMSKAKKLSLANRFDLKDVKTIEKLVSQLDKVVDQLETGLGQMDMLVNDYNKSEDLVKNQREVLDRASDAIDLSKSQINDAKKGLLQTEKAYEKQEKFYDKLSDKNNKAEDKLVGRNEKYKDQYEKGEKLKDSIKSAIKQVEASAKSLGISGQIPAVDLGEIAIRSFDGQVPDAAKNVGY